MYSFNMCARATHLYEPNGHTNCYFQLTLRSDHAPGSDGAMLSSVSIYTEVCVHVNSLAASRYHQVDTLGSSSGSVVVSCLTFQMCGAPQAQNFNGAGTEPRTERASQAHGDSLSSTRVSYMNRNKVTLVGHATRPVHRA